MPIPTQNEFLLPFLQLLNDGQRHMRGQLLYALAQRFNISEEEAQQMSGNQFTLISRVAWCDTHFVAAGFVRKEQDSGDSLRDSFLITTLGVRELQLQPEKITVGYLQSFYRGNVFRGAGSDDMVSEAERVLYDRFEKLPEPFKVFHSVKWFGRNYDTVGEIDFLLAHPSHGVLVVEAKGGEAFIERRGNNSRWMRRHTIYGSVSEMPDPCVQADRNRRALYDWLAELPATKHLRYALFPAVALPNSVVKGDIRPDCPEDIFIDMRHLERMPERLLEIFEYWKLRADAKNKVWGGQPAIDGLINALVPTRNLRPRVADIFERERQKIEELTQNQFRVLRQLRRHRRAAIVGGAGSGKTMLAMEKASQLADEGFRVMLLCYNKNLAQWIGKQLQHPNIIVATFHSIVGQARSWAGLRGTTNYSMQEFDERAADLLLDYLSIIRSPDSGAQDKLFDALIIDEAQDFEDIWWVAIPDLLKSPQEGVLYVFFDDNQRLYRQISNVPMETEPFLLDENCRNTQHIHTALTPYYRATEETLCLGPEGRPVEQIAVKDINAAQRELGSVLHRLVNEDGVRPDQIMILTPASEKRSQWRENTQIGNFRLTWELDTLMENAIRVCTIYSYKGLESAVVILTELDRRRGEISNALIYVGLSRARHHVIVLGELPSADNLTTS